ncbi:uncharacterized protein LOC123540553 [Mercenaria mercenaria]|uniref:uncharacterized protein LOC123540553 n=1 Tax=Mercenaria mercenaria TaxID=6596 RepID=UPI00234F9060|nr:uncharacterized protein LOC123540553 [Mercenaria mercenaria]
MEEEEFIRMAELEEETDEAVKAQQNGEAAEPIDEDIQHTVGQLLHLKPNQRMVCRDSKRNLNTEEIVSKALQAERNHWKERLQMSMHEIDRQHKVILTTQSGLQDLVKSLKHSSQKHVVFDEDDENSNEDLDHEVVSARLIENLKFQVRQLRVRAGISDVSKTEIEESKQKHKMLIKEMKDKIEQLQYEKETLELDQCQKAEKIAYLQKENASLHRQCQKLQKIVAKYNESHSGANFHLNAVDKPKQQLQEKMREKRYSMTSYDSSENGSSVVRERTYVEGDQLVSYPSSLEESAIIKDRLKRNIYSARAGNYRSSNVAQCLRCQTLFKPAENTHKSCQFHHKGREIKQQFQDNGKLEKVLYKWACCKKPLEAPGCCFGYHV